MKEENLKEVFYFKTEEEFNNALGIYFNAKDVSNVSTPLEEDIDNIAFSSEQAREEFKLAKKLI